MARCVVISLGCTVQSASPCCSEELSAWTRPLFRSYCLAPLCSNNGQKLNCTIRELKTAHILARNVTGEGQIRPLLFNSHDQLPSCKTASTSD